MTSTLARYLAYQRDIGIDEIVFDEPLAILKPEPAAIPGSKSAPKTEPVPKHAPTEVEPIHGDGQAILRQVAERLASKSGEMAQASAAQTPVRKVEPGSASLASQALVDKTFPTLAAWREAFEAEASALHPTVKSPKGSEQSPWVYGTGANQATLAVVTLQPASEAEAELWARMLKAMKLEPGDQYFTSLMKAPHPGRGWARKDTVKLIPWLEAELGLVKPHLILALGEDLAQLLLRVGTGYESLRQKSHTFAGHEITMTQGLGRLLTQEELKRDAWKDLQWLMQRLKEKGAIA